MINFVVFSFNRAMQLDALLNSMKNFIEADYQVIVVYNSTSPILQSGYDLLIKKYIDVVFLKEQPNYVKHSLNSLFTFRNLKTYIKYPSVREARTNFRDLVIKAISKNNPDFVCFFTDDSVLVNKFSFSEKIENFIKSDINQNSYSLRLGKNINSCPLNSKKEQNFLVWSFDDFKKGHWRYRFSVDGHIYAREIIEILVKKLIFQNPNTLEPAVFDYAKKHHLLSICMCAKEPTLLSYPLNEVNIAITNFALNISVEKLNNYLLKGFKLEYKIPDKKDIIEFQQFENEIYFKKDEVIEILKL